MSAAELQRRLIDKIQKTNDVKILEEANRFFDITIDEQETYHLNDEQLSRVEEAQKQILNNQFLTNDQANKEIDEWLKKIIWSLKAQEDRKQILNYWIKRNKSTNYRIKLNLKL